jgi:chromosome segregation protein
VYRSGEGEYLINRQVCRLKDIKDLFLGSGAGADAYCIIEQGRVDVLLQASTKERRTIFEEAAGISRFKAKKTETLRRLERVDQNLQRLRDILDEVEKQLRSVKLQAAKAQRYQEYSERLRELRVTLGLQDYHQLRERLEVESGVLDGLRKTLESQLALADAWERDLRQMEERLARLDGSLRAQEAELAGARQQIAAEESTLTHEWALVVDVESDLGQTRQRLVGLTRHVASLADSAARSREELQQVEGHGAVQRQAVGALEEGLQTTVARLATLHEEVQRDKSEHFNSMRQAAHLQNDAVSYKAQVDNLSRERERLLHRSEQAAEHLASLDLELEQLTQADSGLQGRLAQARQVLLDLRQERDRLHRRREETAQQAADFRARRSGLTSRIEVLEGLERSHEGLGAGAREVLALLEQPDPGAWRTVVGVLADFLTVRREYAPLIDLALGERAQRILVRDEAQLTLALQQRSQPFSGRVSFLPVQSNGKPAPALAADAQSILTHPGVIALASQVVRCDDAQFSELPDWLLANTLIVRDMAAARQLSAQVGGCRFITLQGELLEPDGTLTVGMHHAETGILSRKSELRELREQLIQLDQRMVQIEQDQIDLREQIASLDGRVENAQMEIDVLAEQTADLRSRIGQHRQRREGLHEEVEVSRTEITSLEQDILKLEENWRTARAQALQAESLVQTLQTRLEEADREIREREVERHRQQQEAMAARVSLAQTEERLAAFRARHQQIEADLHQRGQERQQSEGRLQTMCGRLEESQRTLLQASSALADWYLRKEAAERHLAEWNREREALAQERQQRADEAQANRATWRTQQEEAHARELEVNDLRHRLDTLCARLKEDYQLDLAEFYRQRREAAVTPPERQPDSTEPAAPPEATSPISSLDPAAAEEEITELRRKLSRLGSVNLEAIQELNELEARSSALQIQFDDLNAAHKALQDIIGKINSDSRRLFSETFNAIRSHFQELFRKLFGGGMADVVMEDESDILESGIEIIARPPGKELRSISLMSGGEKTMTAVALLMAIFRSKPSPFCILDEVDAALDEANIGRFTGVLREFLDRSHFIIITHSKRTMACADALYGVTMQESGISKRYAVRFEDWPDDEAKADEPAA